MSNGSVSVNTPAARLCHILKWEDFDGYGFNLHAEKGKPGQYIGKVDDGSPAEDAGLKQGDRIVEVNGVNISNENHKQVVQRIKAFPDKTELLVVDSEAEKYYKTQNIIIKSSMPDVIHNKTRARGQEADLNGEKADGNSEDTRSQKSEKSVTSGGTEEVAQEKSSLNGRSSTTTPSSERKMSTSPSPEPQFDAEENSFIQSNPTSDGTPGSGNNVNDNNQNGSLNLNMTAKELRAQLAARRKYDPKKDSMDFKKKFDIVQTL